MEGRHGGIPPTDDLAFLHVDHKAVTYVFVDDPFKGLIHIIGLNQFDFGFDTSGGTEVDHFLGFGNATNHGTPQAITAKAHKHTTLALEFAQGAHVHQGGIKF